MSGKSLTLLAPLSGWCLPLAQVPDPVFAQGMAGDGVAIDPTSAHVLAPCDGEVLLAGDARHAVTVRHAGLEVVVHVGIDTVQLGGKGFELLVRSGERVAAGTPLLRFDLEGLARSAPSLVTPVLVPAGTRIARRATGQRLEAGQPLLEVLLDSAPIEDSAGHGSARRRFRLPFEHGLHVRPAAQVTAALRDLRCEVALHFDGRVANARSAVAMMTLGARHGQEIEVVASGADAEAALEALALVLGAALGPAPASLAPPVAPKGRVEATIASRGLAMGPAASWKSIERRVAERGRDPKSEDIALRRALDAVAAHLTALQASAVGEQGELLLGHLELLRDPELGRIADARIAAGHGAGYAWRAASREVAARLAALDDARMRERAADLRDLEGQVLAVLEGDAPDATHRVARGSIVLADDLLPSHVMSVQAQGAAGVCLARGGATSHAAILAAASGLPMLVAAGPSILALAEGTALVLDAEQGVLEIDPPAAMRSTRERDLAERRETERADLAVAREPASTRDGVRIAVLANLGGGDDVEAALRQGAEGCGLLRTEFLFLDRRTPPPEEVQRGKYQQIAAALAGRPLAIRTMDVGGDKPLPYLPMPHEDNPALGLRGLRAGLRDPELLRTQLRAITAVSPAGAARVLLPMVTEVDELRRVRAWLDEAARSLGKERPSLGVMIETPASALLAAQLALEADFLSIGTNDLSQYTLAMDRGHPELARRLDALHPAVLRLIAATVQGAREHGRSVSVCGALAGDEEALPVLVGLGVRELSVAASVVPRVKRRVRQLDAAACESIALQAQALESADAVRALVREGTASKVATLSREDA